MFDEFQKNRLAAEERSVGQFIARQPRIKVAVKNGNPACFYLFTFSDIRTTIVKPDELVLTAPPSLSISTIDLTVGINMPADYPRRKPDIAVIPIPDIEKGEFCIYNTHVVEPYVCLYSVWRMKYSLVDALSRLWNVLGYNHYINLDRTDVLNPAALTWYKNSLFEKTIVFPLDEALINNLNTPQPEKKVFTFMDVQ
jgi:hypothetical protein